LYKKFWNSSNNKEIFGIFLKYRIGNCNWEWHVIFRTEEEDQPGTPPSSPSGRAQNLHDHLEYLGSPSARRLLDDEESGPDTSRKVYWLTKLLEEKERDANLAAEIGKALLLKNEELLNEIENIKRKVEETEEKLRSTEDIRIQNERLQTVRKIYLDFFLFYLKIPQDLLVVFSATWFFTEKLKKQVKWTKHC